MKIRVKLFAILRERAGIAELMLDLPAGATARDAITALAQKCPDVENLVSQAAAAVNQQYVKRDTQLREGDELALIPPVSGG